MLAQTLVSALERLAKTSCMAVARRLIRHCGPTRSQELEAIVLVRGVGDAMPVAQADRSWLPQPHLAHASSASGGPAVVDPDIQGSQMIRNATPAKTWHTPLDEGKL